MTEEPNDLIESLETIRKEDFPDIPKELVEEIVQIEDENIEERELIQNKISNAVESYLEE